MADQYLSNQNLPIDYVGNGGTLQVELWASAGDTFVKNLGGPFLSVIDLAGTKIVNTGVGVDDLIPVGAGHVIKINDGVFSSVAAIPNPIEIVDAHLTTYPTIPWFNAGSVFHVSNLAWNDVEGTIPATIYDTDPPQGVVGNLEGLDLSAAPSNPVQCTVQQVTSSIKPLLKVDGDGYVYTDHEVNFNQFMVTPSEVITNSSTLECEITLELSSDGINGQSAIILTDVLTATRDGGTDLKLGFLSNLTAVGVTPENQKFVVRAVLSSGVAHGDSKLYIDDVEVLSVATYVTSVTTVAKFFFRRPNQSSPSMKLYGATLYREGILTAPQQAAVYQWHKDIAGIV